MIERRLVLPPLAKRIGDRADGGAAHGGLYVVPRGARPVLVVDVDRLRISLVFRRVMTTVTQVDTAGEEIVIGDLGNDIEIVLSILLRWKLNLSGDADNRIVLIENGERSQPFTLRL